jgi:large subunit ribosomal protein L6
MKATSAAMSARPTTVRANWIISLKYFEGTPVIRDLKRVSKPGRRVYMGVKDIPSVRNGLGVSIVSTPKGVMSDAACTRCQCWRRSALHRVLRRVACLVLARNPSNSAQGRFTATISGQTIEVKGPKGTRSFTATDDVTLTLEEGAVKVTPRGTSKRARQQWGMTRSMVENLVTGVTTGFKQGAGNPGRGLPRRDGRQRLKLSLGYSHEVNFDVPAGVTVTSPKQTEIVVEGIDQQLGRPGRREHPRLEAPEPYKGKGIRYKGEFIFRKEGKKK